MPHNSACPDLHVQCSGSSASYTDSTTTLSRSMPAALPADVLCQQTAKLSALVHLMLPGDGEGIAGLNDGMRDNLLWLACDLAEDVHALAQLSAQHHREVCCHDS